MVYVVRVGGDFMHGRLLLPGLFPVDILTALKDGDSRLPAGGGRLWLRVGSSFNRPCWE